VNFFVRNGALDGGIIDYEKWQADSDERQRRFGKNWYPENNEGVALNIYIHALKHP
jgi:hypothetical protein